jgi:hypothetical protein
LKEVLPKIKFADQNVVARLPNAILFMMGRKFYRRKGIIIGIIKVGMLGDFSSFELV